MKIPLPRLRALADGTATDTKPVTAAEARELASWVLERLKSTNYEREATFTLVEYGAFNDFYPLGTFLDPARAQDAAEHHLATRPGARAYNAEAPLIAWKANPQGFFGTGWLGGKKAPNFYTIWQSFLVR